MKLILIIFIVILGFSNMAIGWKAVIERFDVRYIDEKRLKIIEAKIFKYNRSTKAIRFEFESFYDVSPDVMVEIKMFGFMSNVYRLLPFVLTRKICDILQMEYLWVKHTLNSNFQEKCPVPKGRYYLKDYSIDVSRFPKKPWSINNYKIQARIYEKKRNDILADVYVVTTDDDEYVL